MKHHLWTSLLAFTATAWVWGICHAETNDLTAKDLAGLSLEDLMQMEIPTVVTASKHEQKVTEAPASVSVVTADEIKRYGYRNFADLLNAVRGFYVTYDRAYGFTGARGFNRTRDYGGRILLLVDGHRINDPAYGTLAGREDFLLDLDLIERVEIVRGPGSALYGDNAFLGVINIITRRGRDLGGAEVAATYGSFDTYRGRFSYGAESSNGVEVLLSGSLYDSRGDDDLYFPDFDDPATLNGRARGLDDEQSGRLFGRIGYRGFSVSGGWVDREKQIPTARYGSVFGDPNFVAWDKRAYGVAEFQHTLPSDWQIIVRGSYDRYKYRASYPYANEAGATVLNWELLDAQWFGGEVQLSGRIGERHRVTLGAEYRDLFSVDQTYYDEDPYNLIYASDPDFQSGGVFVQDEIRILPNLLLNVGGRLDDYDTFGQTVNPRASLVYSPRATTTLKLLYGEAYRAPNVNEMYYQEGTDIRDVNPNLDAEEVTTYEAVWEEQFAPWLRTSLTAFRNEVSDLIAFSPDVDAITSFYYVNAGEVTAEGTEIEFEAGRRDGVRGRASYAYANVESKDANETFDNSPEHLAKLNLLIPLGSERYTLGLQAQYVSSRLADDGSTIDDYWLAHANLFAQPLGDDLELSVGIYNLFDQSYEDPAYGVPNRVEQDGRSMRVKITKRF